jgi:hypothetical protein
MLRKRKGISQERYTTDKVVTAKLMKQEMYQKCDVININKAMLRR